MINRILILFAFSIIPTVLADSSILIPNPHFRQKEKETLRVKGYHLIGSFGRSEGKFLSPSELATDPDENLYILDTVKHSITKLNRRAEFQWEIYAGENVDASFVEPIDMTNSDGFHLYVLDKLSKAIYQVDGEGEVDIVINLYFLEKPGMIKLLKSQTFLVFDEFRNSVYIVRLDGQVLWEFKLGDTDARSPSDILINGDRIWILFSDPVLIVQYDFFGQIVKRIDLKESLSSMLKSGGRFCLDGNGKLYVSVESKNEVFVMDSFMNLLGGISDSFPLIKFSEPGDVMALTDRIYVADRGNGRIVEIEIGDGE